MKQKHGFDVYTCTQGGQLGIFIVVTGLRQERRVYHERHQADEQAFCVLRGHGQHRRFLPAATFFFRSRPGELKALPDPLLLGAWGLEAVAAEVGIRGELRGDIGANR